MVVPLIVSPISLKKSLNVNKLLIVMKIEIVPIDLSNIDLVVSLLKARNETLPEYVYWKYGFADDKFRGVLALDAGHPVGCFGLIVRDLHISARQKIACGWFADWYVSPQCQGKKVGTQMLAAISRFCPLVFGHPVPEIARQTCLKHGYRLIPFQSRRQMIFKRFNYESHRSRFLPKVASRSLSGSFRSLILKSTANVSSEQSADSNTWSFLDPDEHGRWILSQPIKSGVVRTAASWRDEGLNVVYIDDALSTRVLRRRVLYVSGEQRTSLAQWRRFFQSARQDGCTYAEIFTTEPLLDKIWKRLGADTCNEPPILFKRDSNILLAGNVQPEELSLQGWDRENWTYLAFN